MIVYIFCSITIIILHLMLTKGSFFLDLFYVCVQIDLQ